MRAVSSNFLRLLAMVACTAACRGQGPLASFRFGGTGTDAIHGVATDAAGNIYVAGTTYSSDLPTLNPYQSGNSGTQVVSSADSGATWKPLGSPLAPSPGSLANLALAVDPTNPAIVYVASGTTFCRSKDSGASFQCSILSFFAPGNAGSILVDPHTPSRLYLTINPSGGLFVSPDGGSTWNSAGQGLPQKGFPYQLSADPFRAGVLYVWTGDGGFVSRDAGATFVDSGLPYPSGGGTAESFFGFLFDLATPGVIYGPGVIGMPGNGGKFTLQKSTDGGKTWTALSLPFQITSFVGADPSLPGTLYALGAKSGSPPAFWKSTDGGSTWNSLPIPSGLSGPLTFDPHNSQVILAPFYGTIPASLQATYRSMDGGNTWTQVAQRVLAPAFAASAQGIVYATGNATSDAFLAKFLPDGKTLVFSTYFGGGANESLSGVALDPSGNIWIGGNTSSTDLPMAGTPFEAALKGTNNGFIAKFSPDGQLIASTYLGGSSRDTLSALAASPDGSVWVGGNWTSFDFPFRVATTILPSPVSYLVRLDAGLASAPVAMPLDGWLDTNGNAIAVDGSANVLVVGSTSNPNFRATVQPLPNNVPATSHSSRAFVEKFDPSGTVIFSTAFSGSKAAPVVGYGIGLPSGGGLENSAVAAAVDQDGNAYIAGYTSATDFPVTTGAFQTSLAGQCPYPAFENNTGLIGVIAAYYMDDSFVVKLSPDGKTVVYSTLLGGQCFDHPASLAVDPAGRAAIAGETDSFDYPQVFAVSAAPARAQFASFVSILNPSGSGLDFSSYLYAGSTPVVVASASGAFAIGGGTGPNAQTAMASGAFLSPYSGPPTHGYLGLLVPQQPPPPLNLSEVLNAFSFLTGPVAPGELVTLSVPGFSPAAPADVGIYPQSPLSTSLSGVSVLFDGHPAYLKSVTQDKITCIVPVAVAGQTSTAVQVTAGTSSSNVLSVNVAPTAVGLLSLDGSGAGLANARNSDGTLNGPDNPAPAGSPVTVYFTGGGVTNPSESDGVLPTSLLQAPVANPAIFPSGGVVYALPGFLPGLFSYTFTVPSSAPSGGFTVSAGSIYYQTHFLRIYVH